MKKAIYSLTLLLATAGTAQGAVVSYYSEAAFQNDLGNFTVIDTVADTGKTDAQVSAENDGFEFFGTGSFSLTSGWIPNGAGNLGASTPSIGMNFNYGTDGFGVTSNSGDGGTIYVYSGLNATGTLLGSMAFGTATGSLFGGFISDSWDIQSAVVTCEYDWDLRCGLANPTYGTAAVPAPAMLGLVGLGLLGTLGLRRRRA